MNFDAMIPVMRPKLPTIDQLKPYLDEMSQTGIYSNFGPISLKLRTIYSKYLNVPMENLVPIANATLALQGALEILKQKNWIIPDYTFAATAQAAIAARKSVHIADVREDNFQLSVPANIDQSQYGLIPVMPFGAPINFQDWQGHKALVIDAAASLGAPPPDFREMPVDSMIVYSLHATKVLGAGEGALVVCQNHENAEELQSWSNFGFHKSRVSSILGTNAKMSEFAAAVALASIQDLNIEESEWMTVLSQTRNLDIPKRYQTIVSDYPGFRPYWIIQTRDSIERSRLEKYLQNKNIETRRWWSLRVSDMPAFKDLNMISDTPVSQKFADTHLGLPLWRNMPPGHVPYIAKMISEFDLN